MAIDRRLFRLSYAVLLVVCGCGSQQDIASSAADSDASVESPQPSAPVMDASAPSTGTTTEYVFEGKADLEQGTMTIVSRTPTGGIVSQVTLPYGDSTGHVFFHTCSAGWDGGTHEIWGNVQGLNLMPTTTAVDSLTAVIDSVSVSGVTPSSGTIASYGNVAPNSADCSSSQSWVFSDPTSTTFSFTGHATGTIACAAGECPTKAQNGCQATGTGSDVNNCGSCGHVCSATSGHYATCAGGTCHNNSCSTCPGGQYASTACTSTSDTICSLCSTCGSGQYASTACTSTSDTVCSTCSTCGVGQYQSSACTSTADTVCGTCTTCGSGQYQTSACTSTTNTGCATCATCGAGQYISSACGGTSNTTCTNCTICANNQYTAAACGASSNTVCANCDPTCLTCDGAGNTACTSCEAPLVPSGP